MLGTWEALLGVLPAPLVCVVVGCTVAAEGALLWGVVLPGASALLAMGFLARLGVVGLHWAVATGMSAALAGSTVGYLRGRGSNLHGRAVRLAERLVERITGRPPRTAEAISRRWSGPAVAGAQWAAVSRTLMPRLVASAGWPYRRFAAWSVPSAAAWGGGQVCVGWLAGAAYREVARWSSWLGAAGLLIVLTVGLVAATRSSRSARRARAATAPSPTSSTAGL